MAMAVMVGGIMAQASSLRAGLSRAQNAAAGDARAREVVMSDEPVEPRAARGATLSHLEREDLDIYGVEELTDRIDRLRAEIARAEAKRAAKQAGRGAAEALFR
jgi:uncharacterized small protein (DUF1192 family)